MYFNGECLEIIGLRRCVDLDHLDAIQCISDFLIHVRQSNHTSASPHPPPPTKTKTYLLQTPRFSPVRRSSTRRQLNPSKGGSLNSGTGLRRWQMQQSPRNDSIGKVRYLACLLMYTKFLFFSCFALFILLLVEASIYLYLSQLPNNLQFSATRSMVSSAPFTLPSGSSYLLPSNSIKKMY